MSPTEQFKINLTQNLWGVIVSFGALGVAEYLHLCTLFWFSVFVSAIMMISIAITTFAYTANYWKGKQ